MRRLRHIVKSCIVPVLHEAGAFRLVNKLDKSDRQIALAYHNVDAGIFASHAAFLANQAQVVGLESFLYGNVSRDLSKPLITITFDDGYAAFAENIVSILARYNLPATWFVPTAAIGTDRIYWFDRLRTAILFSKRDEIQFEGKKWELRSWNRKYVAAAISGAIKKKHPDEQQPLIDRVIGHLGEAPASELKRFQPASTKQLRSLDPDLITIGSHSSTHSQLSQLTKNALTSELVDSKRRLEDWTQRPVLHFAFPSGDFNAEIVGAVRDAGYISGWTTEPRFRQRTDDRYAMPRVSIDDQAPVGILAAKMTSIMRALGE